MHLANTHYIGSATPSPIREMSHSQSQDLSRAFPTLRAISEPPPDADEHEPLAGSPPQNQTSSPLTSKLPLLLPTQEYSWEWGAFPQPSPMKTTFGKSGRPWGKGKGKASMDVLGLSSVDVAEEIQERGNEHEHGRSHSVPPELDGSPTKQRKHRELPEDEEPEQVYDLDEDLYDVGHTDTALLGFGKGGKLKPCPTDPTRFTLSIDGRDVTFELSLMPHPERVINIDGSMSDPEEPEERGRRNRYDRLGGTQEFGKLGKVESARLFSLGKVDYDRFLDDDYLVDDPRLVVRWTGDQ